MGKELLETLLFSSDTGGRGVAVEDAGGERASRNTSSLIFFCVTVRAVQRSTMLSEAFRVVAALAVLR